MTPSPSSPLPNRRRRCTHLISIWASVRPTDLARLAPDSTCSRSAVAHLLTPLTNPTAAPRSPSPPLCSHVIDWLSVRPPMLHRRITGAVTLAVTEEVPVTSLLARY